MEMKKPSMGRQKIAMAKIAKKNHLQVTFSKRREGLFKKASELSTLCGAEIAIIVFSPANRPYSFGHPNVDSIIDRFLARNPPSLGSGKQRLIEAHQNTKISELNMQLTQALHQLELERKHGQVQSEKQNARRSQCWWEAPINELGLQELQQLKTAMEELKKNVEKQANKMLNQSTNHSPFFGRNGMGNTNPYEGKPLEIPSATNLEQLKTTMEELKKNVGKQTNKIFSESINPLPFFGVNGVETIHPYEGKPLDIPSANNVHPLFSYGHCYGLH